MAKDKDKALNPAAAARKAEKAKAVKKGKAAITQQRNDRLSRQNPHRIQSQITDLQALEANHSINPREKKQLDELQRDLARVIKAKEAIGEKYIPRLSHDTHAPSPRGDSSVLGKRTRGAARHGYVSSPSSDTDPDVGEIPMPRDTPPPLPRWRRKDDIAAGVGNGMNGGERQTAHVLPEKLEQIVPPSSQAVYESKPVLRDLRKEAAAFVPAAVAARRRLLDSGAAPLVVEEGDESCSNVIASQPDHDADLNKKLQEEEERWRRETKQVTIEDVNDEDT